MADEDGELATLLGGGRVNAILSWVLAGLVGAVAVQSVLAGTWLRGAFAAGILVLAVLPPAIYRSPTVMLPWEVLFLGVLPVLGRSLAGPPMTARITTHLSVAALALVVAVELDVFTSVRMTDWFAVLFVVIATMAMAGLWAVSQWLSDVYLGTAYLLTGAPEHEIEAVVMWDFVAATVAGILAGVVFELYFRRRARGKRRLPRRTREGVE